LQAQLYVERQAHMCTRSAFTHLPEGRMHPACCVATTAKPNMCARAILRYDLILIRIMF